MSPKNTVKQHFQYLNEFSNVTDSRTIAKILQIKQMPTDPKNAHLITMKKTFVNDVFPSAYFGEIFTPRVSPVNMAGFVLSRPFGATDDITYNLYPEIQKIIPRCFSILLIFNKGTKALVARHTLQGYYKFGGAARDEDSNIDTHSLLSKKSLENATRVVVTEKSNGKAAVITMFVFEKELYVFGGSKGQHYVGKMDKGILTFDYLNKQYFAWQILDSFFKAWNTLQPNAQKLLALKLVGSEEDDFDGYTACGEYEDGKHMIPMPKGMANRIVMFGLVKNCASVPRGEELCEDVEQSLEFFKAVGLSYTPFFVCGVEESEKIKEDLREKRGVEGYVIHYQEEKDGHRTTAGIEKFKTWYYIVIRVVREFLRGRELADNWQKNLKVRLIKRNKDYMNMPSKMLSKWIDLSIMFIEWMQKSGISKEEIGFRTEDVGMGNTWFRFLRENPNANDDIRMDENDREKISTHHRGVLLIFQGIPGLGKSHVAEQIVAAFEAKGIRAVAVEQDPFAKFGKAKSGEKCLQHCAELMKSGEHSVILLMRNNSSFLQYSQYISVAYNNEWLVHVMTPHDFLNDSMRYLAVCLYSVFSRAHDSAAQHPTFKNLSLAKQFAITLSFFAVFVKAEKRGKIDFVDEIDWLRPSEGGRFGLSSSAQEALAKLVELVRKMKNPFKFDEKNVNVEGLKRDLDFDNIDYHSWREKPEQIAEKVVRFTLDKSLIGKEEIKKVLAPTKDMVYAYIPVPEDVFNELIEIVHSKGLFVDDLTSRPPTPHVTLIYQDQTSKKGAEIWRKCLEMISKDESVRVIINGFAYWPNKLICFTCRLHSPLDNRNFLGLCISGHPHITALFSAQTKPKESVDLLTKLSIAKPPHGSRYVSLGKVLVFDSKVEIYKAR